MKILKKYPNRRIYDTSISAYIKVTDVRQMVLACEPFKVVDSKSGEDLTRATLLQIISDLEAEGQRSLLTNRILEELIRFYDDQYAPLISSLIEQQILAFLKEQDKFRAGLKELGTLKLATPEELLKNYIETLTGGGPKR
ncbi:MAG: polyhydroxyalkanoate synthesis repressor PhaR [Zhongshania sp.]